MLKDPLKNNIRLQTDFFYLYIKLIAMKKLNFLFFLLLLLPQVIFSQESYTPLQTISGEVKIPGKWQQLNTAEDSGQTYLKNSDNVIIAIAKNPKRAYPFYAKEKSDFENVIAFYKWDADYRESLNSKTQKLKENPKAEYIIWKYNDGKSDNVFLFGSSQKDFLNLLVYTNNWTEEQKIKFLENLFEVNK